MALYPNSQPGNLKASLYLNNKRRDKFLPLIEQGQAWAEGVWYQVGDTVVYDAITYRSTSTHQAELNPAADIAAFDKPHWVVVT